MADSTDIVSNLSDAHWELKDDCDNKDDFKRLRLARHTDKGNGAFAYLAQSLDEDGDIYQLSINDTKGGDPFGGVQIVMLAIKDGKEIVGIECVDGKYFVRK